jgi:nucleotide-binding universal stress UspA family protein
MGSNKVTKERTMYRHLLVATDGSKLSEKEFAHALMLAKATGAQVTALYASPGYPAPVYMESYPYVQMTRKEYGEFCKKEADNVLKPLSLQAEQSGVEFDSAHAVGSAPWEAILAAARKNKCDAIVMASHGRRGVSAFLLGSETHKVLTHTKLPVIVVH